MKKTLAIVLCLAMLFAIGCKKESEPAMRVGALIGPTGMGLAYMITEPSDAYESIALYDAPDAITGKFISGELDIAAVPINLASVLYKKTEGNAVMIAVNTLGVLYVLENGEAVRSMADLSGKKIYATGQGSTPEYVLNALLEKNGVADAEIEYVGEHAVLASMLAAGEATLAMLPEPNVTAVQLKNADVHIALNLDEEWQKVTGEPLVQGCYIVSRTFYEAHPKAVQQFLKDYAASVERVNSAADAAETIANAGVLPSAAIAAKAIPTCNIVCITGDDMQKKASMMLETLYAANPASIGGALPDDAFYAR